MSRQKKNSEEYNMEFFLNKNAFTDVIGDPFAIPEAIEGHYITLRKRSTIGVANNNFDSGKATRNTAQPNMMDFFCDVERVVNSNLTEDEIVRFQETYITEELESLSSTDRIVVEQKLGQIFRWQGISPVSKYFKTVRSSANKERDKRNGRADTINIGKQHGKLTL